MVMTHLLAHPHTIFDEKHDSHKQWPILLFYVMLLYGVAIASN